MSRKIMALLLCLTLVFSSSVWISAAAEDVSEPLVITFDQAASTPGGESHWNIQNANPVAVPYQFQLVGSTGTTPERIGVGIATVGNSILVTDTVDTELPRIDKISIHWEQELADATTDASITAFSTEFFLLTAAAVHGDIQKDDDSDSLLGTTNYWKDTMLDLEAVPIAQSEFDSWGGDMTGSDDTNPDELLMDSDKTISAVFTLKDYDVTVSTSISGNGEGSVTGGGIFAAFSTPTIIATPDADSWFEGWYLQGNFVSDSATFTLPGIMTDVTYVANFVADGTSYPEARLVLDKKANGSDGPVSLNVNGTVTYTILVTNAGNVTVSAIELVDSMAWDSPYDAFILAPLASKEFTFTKTFHDAGNYTNTATVGGIAMMVPFDSEEDAIEVDVGPYVDQVMVTVSTPTPTPTPTATPTASQTTSTYVAPNVSFTVVNEGPGHALPGTGVFSQNSVIQMLILPDAGATFVGWFGTNGSEMLDGRILMTGNKSVIARFAPIGTIPDTTIPVAPPVITPEPIVVPVVTPTPQPVEIPVVELPQEEVPEAAPTLPQTAGFPIELYGVFASGLIGTGILLRRKSTRK